MSGGYAAEVARRLAELEARGEEIDEPDPPSARELARAKAKEARLAHRRALDKASRDRVRARDAKAKAERAAREIRERQRLVQRLAGRALAAVESVTGVSAALLREGHRPHGDGAGILIARRLVVWSMVRVCGLGVIEAGEQVKTGSSTCYKALDLVEAGSDPLQSRLAEEVRAALKRAGVPS